MEIDLIINEMQAVIELIDEMDKTYINGREPDEDEKKKQRETRLKTLNGVTKLVAVLQQCDLYTRCKRWK